MNMYHKLRAVGKKIVIGLGIVKPGVSKDTWEKQYSSGAWDYLESEKEREHYVAIVDFLKDYIKQGEILDIGCGTGVLYKYLSGNNALNDKVYHGIDISENAVLTARQNYKGVHFNALDYQTQNIEKAFDCIIFNETLYYFENAGNTLKKCINENLQKDGKLIVSMVDYGHHHLIWDFIDSNYQVLDQKTVTNEDGVSWTIKVLSPKS